MKMYRSCVALMEAFYTKFKYITPTLLGIATVAGTVATFINGGKRAETAVNDLAVGEEQEVAAVSSLAVGQEQVVVTVNSLAVGQEQMAVVVNSLAVAVNSLAVAVNSLAVGQEQMAVAQKQIAVAQKQMAVAQKQMEQMTVAQKQMALAIEKLMAGITAVITAVSKLAIAVDKMQSEIKNLKIQEERKNIEYIELNLELMEANVPAEQKAKAYERIKSFVDGDDCSEVMDIANFPILKAKMDENFAYAPTREDSQAFLSECRSRYDHPEMCDLMEMALTKLLQCYAHIKAEVQENTTQDLSTPHNPCSNDSGLPATPETPETTS